VARRTLQRLQKQACDRAKKVPFARAHVERSHCPEGGLGLCIASVGGLLEPEPRVGEVWVHTHAIAVASAQVVLRTQTITRQTQAQVSLQQAQAGRWSAEEGGVKHCGPVVIG